MNLSTAFPELSVAKLLETGEIREHVHPDGATRMWSLQTEIPSCEMAANMRGVIFRDGEILARPIRKFWKVETEGFPETRWKTLGRLSFKNAVHTEFIDGHAGLLYHNRHGIPLMAGKNSFINQPWIWASGRYREHFRTANWPAEYSPNFVVVHPEHVKTIAYEEPEIYLVGMVHLGTGAELPWQDVKDWGRYNDVPVPRLVISSPFDFPYLKLTQRGVVMRWDFIDQTLRVAWVTEDYENRSVIEGFTPLDVAEMLEQDLDVEPLKKHGDAKFSRWLETWKMRLHNRYWAVENRVVELLSLADNVVPPVAEDEMEGLMDFFGKNCGEDIWTLSVLRLWLLEKDYTPLIWGETKKICRGEGAFSR